MNGVSTSTSRIKKRGGKRYVIVGTRLLTIQLTPGQMWLWGKNVEACTTNRSCADHALAFLKLLPENEYRDVVKLRNTKVDARGRTPEEILNLVNARAFRTFEMLPVHLQTDADMIELFSYIPRLSATLVMMWRDADLGHVVVFTNDADGEHLIYDPTTNLVITGIKNINRFIKAYELNRHALVCGVRPSVETRGEKRTRSPTPTVELRRPRTHKHQRTTRTPEPPIDTKPLTHATTATHVTPRTRTRTRTTAL